MTEYLPEWNGIKKGEKVMADGQPCTLVHAVVRDGVVQHLMVVSEYRTWFAVSPDEVVPMKKGKK
jgi:hypothetical protein